MAQKGENWRSPPDGSNPKCPRNLSHNSCKCSLCWEGVGDGGSRKGQGGRSSLHHTCWSLMTVPRGAPSAGAWA